MRVIIPIEARLQRTPDGRCWTRGPSNYTFWSRYRVAFDEVRLLARVLDVEEPLTGAHRVDGPGLSVAGLPYYVGPRAFLQNSVRVRRSLRTELAGRDAVLMRMPGQVSGTCLSLLSADRPFGVEVVGDPRQVFAPGAVSHPLRPFFRWAFSRTLSRAAARASCISYVTSEYLQSRYPPSPDAFVTNYSSVDLPPEAFGGVRRLRDGAVRRCVTVGSLDQRYKGIDTIVTAVKLCRGAGLELELVVIGHGHLLAELEAHARSMGVGQHVTFVGQLPAGPAVREVLDQADVFVLASRTEGLPRAMIEGMARGLPALGTPVGGIPELLEDEHLFPVDDAPELARRLTGLLASSEAYRAASERSLRVAASYSSDNLVKRRTEMYERLRAATEAWAGA